MSNRHCGRKVGASRCDARTAQRAVPTNFPALSLTPLPGFCKNRNHDMRLSGHARGSFLGSALLAILSLCPGCQTATQSLFTASGPGWHVQEGQALWRPGRELPEIGGDLVLASHADGRCLIQFDKTLMTLVSAQTTRTHWLVRFPPRRLGFAGRHAPPTRFAWLYLPAALAGEPLPEPFCFQRKPDGGWRLENTRTGETLEGFLSP
jgi:hypothetical protein